jgi:hypothetical protein
VYTNQRRNIYKEETTWQTQKKMDEYTKMDDDGEFIYLV